MRNRFNRIINPKTKRCIMLAIDHGYFMGPTTGLEQAGNAVKDLIPHANALMLTRGVLRHDISPEVDIPIILRVSGGTSILNEKLLHEGITVSMKEAVKLNVSAVAFSVLIGAKWERDTVLAFSQVVDEAEDHGIPTLAVTAVGKELVRDARYLSLASRMAAEHGARMVKTYYCEGFEKVVDTCPVPIVIAGGKKLPEKEALEMAYNAIQAGAVGVDMGRNIFQSEHPVPMIKAVNEIVHKNATAKEAFQFFEENKS